MIPIHCKFDETIEIDTLKFHPMNANTHSEEQIERLAKILEYQGWRYPVKVSIQSGLITSGHGRVLAAKKLGLTSVPVNFQNYANEDMEIADLHADNEIARWAELDMSVLNQSLADLDPSFDLDLLGIKNFEIDGAAPELGDEDSVPEVQKESISKLGDLYLLGEHRLLCADSTNIQHVEKLMNGEKADMVFTDPPYNIASDSKNHAADLSKSMNDLKNAEWDKNFDIEPSLSCISMSISENCTIFIWTSHFIIQKIWDHLNQWCDFTSYLVWNKPNPMPSLSKRHPTWNTELCVYGSVGSKRTINFPNEGHFLSCRTVTKKSDGTHPTQKPIELIEPIIGFASGKNQIILDLFGGSGSTLIACEKTNRKCFMSELDPQYIDVIIKRFIKYANKPVYRIEESGNKIDVTKDFS